MSSTIHDAAVLGAGISGLSAARRLAEAGLDVVVLEKSRGPGGRAATRRIACSEGGQVRMDHGAQFFTARDTLFRAQLADWLTRGVCHEWATGFHTWDGSALLPPDPKWDAPRYACAAGMNALGKDLAAGLDVRTDCKIVSVRRDDSVWFLEAEDGSAVHARALLCSAPIPQSLALLEQGLTPEEHGYLSRFSYGPCLAVMAIYGKQTKFPAWNGIQVRDAGSPLAWMALDSSKRKPEATRPALVLHATPDFSATHAAAPEDREGAAQRMLEEAACIAGDWAGTPEQSTQHWWRYAMPAEDGTAEGFYRGESGLYVIGDAFEGGRIEGAWLSGRKAAEDLLMKA